MKLHFICRGNVYRSRMAEAYAMALSKDNPAVEISSSGIEASLALNGTVDPDAVEALRNDRIDSYLSATWQQTTQALLDSAELNIFLSKSVFADASQKYKVDTLKAIVWEVPDIDGVYGLVKQQVDLLFETHEL